MKADARRAASVSVIEGTELKTEEIEEEATDRTSEIARTAVEEEADL